LLLCEVERNPVVIREKDPIDIHGVTLTLSFYSGSPEVGTELAKELKEAGITVKLDPQGDATYDSVVFGGGAEMFFAGTSSDALDASDVFLNDFSSDNYKTDAIDKLIASAGETLNESGRLKTLQQISKQLMDTYAEAPIYSLRSNWIVDKSYVFSKDTAGGPLGVNFYKVYQK